MGASRKSKYNGMDATLQNELAHL